MVEEKHEISLLNLTPVCLQNTNNIMNTLLFMSLDQGHDFRDNSDRTNVNGIKAWINADISIREETGKVVYLNKVPKKDFEENYAPNTGDNSIDASKIFGQYDFVKGLINTTFFGGNGVFGLVVVEDVDYEKISETDKEEYISRIIIQQLIDNGVGIRISKTGDSYILYSVNDIGTEGSGVNFETNIDNNIINILFLPFYKRAFNNGMHKLWTFNTKKHIYVIRIDNLTITRQDIRVNESDDESEVVKKYEILKSPEFKCEKLTVIDLLIPQYYLNFEEFIKKFKTSDAKMKNLKNDNQGAELLKDYIDQNTDKVFEEFSKAIFMGLFKKEMIGKKKSDKSEDTFTYADEQHENSSLIRYEISEENVGYFELDQNTSKRFYQCVPRGVKYWFQTSKSVLFKYFLRLLYGYQKPLIHPQYRINNSIGNLEDAKKTIIDSLLNDDNKGLKDYISIKNSDKNFPVSSIDFPFILKQYGVVPDTNIGFGDQHTTINYLINSLNNIDNGINPEACQGNITTNILQTITDTGNYSVGGGNFDFLKGTIEDDDLELLEEMSDITDKSSERLLKKIFKQLKGNDKDIEKLSNYLISKYGDEGKSVLDSIGITIQAPESTQEMKEEIKDVALAPVVIKEPTPAAIEPHQPYFNNIRNVDQVFNLDLKVDEIKDEPFVKINSKTPNVDIKHYENEYSNKLQQYYDFIEQNENPSVISNNYFNNCWQTVDFFQEEKIEKSSKSSKVVDTNTVSTSATTDIDTFTPSSSASSNTSDIDTFTTSSDTASSAVTNTDTYTSSSDAITATSSKLANYPFKFSITSGSLDSSGLGGQSIPQYHPPEVDIYMPIFELNGSGKLKGIIARMVFVKEVLNNATNSKSVVVVFSHFVYVDFLRTGINEPSSINEYPTKLEELLRYAIEYTYYIGNEECVDLKNLSTVDINSEGQVDFLLKFKHNTNSSNSEMQNEDFIFRKWYKYYTYSQGPTVNKSIVEPTNIYEPSLSFIKSSVESDIAARGIVNVAEYLIKNSKTLRDIYGVKSDLENDTDLDTDPGLVFFVKLFLIRNKYIGDKSRATDTLFLNQSKYLEGIQMSNDENTLYNANMFGQNSIWSTSTKSVFYMAPYFTKNNKMPITGGFYINELCLGLANNPDIPPSKDTSGEDSKKQTTDDKDLRNLYLEEITDDLTSDLIDEYAECLLHKKLVTNIIAAKSRVLNEGFIDVLIDKISTYSKFQTALKDFLNFYNNFNERLNETILIFNNNIDSQKNPTLEREKREWGYISLFIKAPGDSIVSLTSNVLDKLKNIDSIDLLDFIKDIKECGINPNRLYNFILYVSKKYPWWIEKIKEYYSKIILEKYCYMCSAILCKFYDKLLTLPEDRKKFKDNVGFYINSRWTEMMEVEEAEECLKNFEFVKTTLKSSAVFSLKDPSKCPPSKPSNESPPLGCFNQTGPIDADTLKETNTKLKYVTLNLLELLSQLSINKDKTTIYNNSLNFIDEINTRSILPNDNDVMNRLKESLNIHIAPVQKVDIAKTIGGSKNNNIIKNILPASSFQIGGIETDFSEKEPTQLINSDELNIFYENSYKCNVGNYLKSFVPIIKFINEKYVDLNITKTDSLKDIIVKILVSDINSINLSYFPALTSDKILDKINKVDDSYTVEQMNSIKNLYFKQFETYSLIDTVSNTDYEDKSERLLLIDLIDENMSENRYKQLKIPFNKLQLLNAILTNDTNLLLKQLVNQSSIEPIEEETISQTFEPTSQSSIQPTSEHTVTYTDYKTKSPEIFKQNYGQLKNYIKKAMPENTGKTSVAVAAGGSIKNNRKRRLNKTRNNKKKNKKYTIKKRKSNIKRYTIKR